ncbi:MAG: prepilin-type N-terminal cleavage/methylation domain-containing protein [Gammaproteobacteria bacterium]|nr:MAG: prepilin-type N-terminal cleavage/methylation domain-containing protein [Gammaproteobacteria bacterium]
MKFTNLNSTKRSLQRGFTLMEISIVLIILAALVATMASNLWSRQDAMSYQQAILFFQKTLPQAMASMRLSGDGDCLTSAGCAAVGGTTPTITQKLQEYGAPTVTEWGEEWTAAYGDGVLEIQYCTAGLSVDALASLNKNIVNASKEGGALVRDDATSNLPAVVLQGQTTSQASGGVSFTANNPTCTVKAFYYVRTR